MLPWRAFLSSTIGYLIKQILIVVKGHFKKNETLGINIGRDQSFKIGECHVRKEGNLNKYLPP